VVWSRGMPTTVQVGARSRNPAPPPAGGGGSPRFGRDGRAGASGGRGWHPGSMTDAVRQGMGHGPHLADDGCRVPGRIRPPRWTFALAGSRVRMSVGMAAWVVVAAALPVWRPALPLVWAPLVVVLGAAASTLVHEGAHAWVAHVLGYRVDWVVVGGLVGVTAYEGRDDRPLERAAVALAGPAASAALVLALLAGQAVLDPTGLAGLVAEAAIGLNALALAANLVPVGGTDGALLVRAVVQHRRNGRTAPAVAAAAQHS
jgi:Zn-dependent protease